MHTVFNLSARYPCNLLCFRNAERELTLLSNVLFLYLYETNQQQYEREVAWICNRHCAFRLAGRDGFRRRTAILGANGKKVGVLVAVRRRRRARVESPHLTRVVPRQEMFQGVPASAYSDHHVSPLQKLRTSRISLYYIQLKNASFQFQLLKKYKKFLPVSSGNIVFLFSFVRNFLNFIYNYLNIVRTLMKTFRPAI